MDKSMIAIGLGPKSYDDSDYPEFDLPKGVDFSDVPEGEEKEVTAMLRKKEDGKVCVIAINGVPLKQDDEESEEQPDDETAESGPADSQSIAPSSPQAGMSAGAQSVGLM